MLVFHWIHIYRIMPNWKRNARATIISIPHDTSDVYVNRDDSSGNTSEPPKSKRIYATNLFGENRFKVKNEISITVAHVNCFCTLPLLAARACGRDTTATLVCHPLFRACRHCSTLYAALSPCRYTKVFTPEWQYHVKTVLYLHPMDMNYDFWMPLIFNGRN